MRPGTADGEGVATREGCRGSAGQLALERATLVHERRRVLAGEPLVDPLRDLEGGDDLGAPLLPEELRHEGHGDRAAHRAERAPTTIPAMTERGRGPSPLTSAAEGLALVSRRVITPEGERPGAVLVRDQTIVGVLDAAAVPPHAHVEDVGETVLMPGLVDSHVHVNEPGRTDWEGFASATRAAAAGGVTTLVDMPLNSSPVTTTRDALLRKRDAAAGQGLMDCAFWGGLVPGNLGELGKLLDAGARGVKAFLCHSGIDDFPAAGEAEPRPEPGD